MNVQQFSEKYNLHHNTLMVRKSGGYISSDAFYKSPKHAVMQVNEKWFIKRWELIKRVQLDNQELYYLITEYFSTMTLCREIKNLYGGSVGSYSEYFARDLFSQSSDNRIKVGIVAWRVWRYFRTIERRLKRRGTSMTKMLDKRMMEEVA